MSTPQLPPEIRLPRYDWGMEVTAAVDLYNDGSLPDIPEDTLLIVAGGPGEIVQVGRHEEANVPLYLVDFGLVVLGCLEEEITPRGAIAAGPRPGVMEALP